MAEGQPSARRAVCWELKSPQRRRARGPGLASRRAPAARAPCRPCCAPGAPRHPSPVPVALWSPRGRRRHVRPLPQLGGRRAREGRPQHPLLGPPQVRAGAREGRGCPPVVWGAGGPGCFPQEPAAGLSVFASSSPRGRRGSVLGGRDRGCDVCGFSPDKPTAFCGVIEAIRKKSVVLPETAVGLRAAGPRCCGAWGVSCWQLYSCWVGAW